MAHRFACYLLLGGIACLLGTGCAPARPAPQPSPVLPRPPSEAAPGQVWLSPVDEMALVYVPGGTFWMGASPNDLLAAPDEHPPALVFLSPFWIDQTEVTNGMYALCVSEGGCTPPRDRYSLTRPDYYENFAFAEYPVVNVAWQQAQAYCTWAGRQLPTEAGWEKAARGPDQRPYPWGDAPPTCNLVNFGNPGPGQTRCTPDTTLAGAYPAGSSPYGALDMAGNVAEWTADWYAADAYALDAQNGPALDPSGPTGGETKVIRGGSWNDGPAALRTAHRSHSHPENAGYFVGFRCALPASP